MRERGSLYIKPNQVFYPLMISTSLRIEAYTVVTVIQRVAPPALALALALR